MSLKYDSSPSSCFCCAQFHQTLTLLRPFCKIVEIIKNSFNKNWIPVYSIYRPEVIESKYLLNKHKISKFNVSQKIIGETDLDFSSANTIKATDIYTYFRMVAYNYPIRFDSQSKYFLFFLNEKTSEKCKTLDKGKYLKLLIC